jgi:excinuclease ABC subunit C
MQTRNNVNDGSEYFGPYTSVVMVKAILDLIRHLYKLRTCSLVLSKDAIEKGKYKRCLEYHLGNCLAPCEGLFDEESYLEGIHEIREILKGNYQQVIQQLKKMMLAHSAKYDFEGAELIRLKIEALEKYKGKSTIVNPKIHNVDVFSILNEDNRSYVNFLKIVKGAVVQSHNLEIIKRIDELDEEILASVIFELRNRFRSNATEVIVPFKPGSEYEKIRWVVPMRGDKKKLLELSERNAASYKRDKTMARDGNTRSDAKVSVLESLRKDLRMNKLPNLIECFDNSNIQGQNPVASCVVFQSGKPDKSEYRHYNIKTVEGPNDFASMEEIVFRRYTRVLSEGKSLPDLIIVDGGKGQLSAARKILEELKIADKVAIIGIAKRLEEIYVPGDSVPLYLDKNSPSLRLIQGIRDEAHRFGITFHRNKRSMTFLQSELDGINGIGESTRELIQKKIKDLAQLKQMDMPEMAKMMGKRAATILYRHFHPVQSKPESIKGE